MFACSHAWSKHALSRVFGPAHRGHAYERLYHATHHCFSHKNFRGEPLKIVA